MGDVEYVAKEDGRRRGCRHAIRVITMSIVHLNAKSILSMVQYVKRIMRDGCSEKCSERDEEREGGNGSSSG